MKRFCLIMSSDVLESQMKTLDAVGLKLPFAEVYNALEQGVVDGQEKAVMQKALEPVHKANPDVIPNRWIDEIYTMK